MDGPIMFISLLCGCTNIYGIDLDNVKAEKLVFPGEKAILLSAMESESNKKADLDGEAKCPVKICFLTIFCYVPRITGIVFWIMRFAQ